MIARLALAYGLALSGMRGGDPQIARVTQSVCSKDVVLLGELPSHGEARTFELKAQVARALVEKCGFNAVLFEAPIYDFIGLQSAIRNGSAEPSMLDNAMGRFWLNQELADFRAWLFKQAQSRRRFVGGVDDQVSITSVYAPQRLPELASPECTAIVKRNLEYTYNDAQPFDDAEKQRLLKCATTESKEVLLRNFRTYVERQVGALGARSRDEVMTENIRWYQSQLPRHTRIIVWTATVHAAPIAKAIGNRAAAIGFTALAGQTSMPGKQPKPLPDLPPNSLESQALTGNMEWVFLSHGQLARFDNAPSRLLGKITSAKWSDYFDGVIVIRNEAAPTFQAIR